MNMEITGAGYEALKKSNLYFTIPYSIEGVLSFAPMFIEVIAENKADAIKWVKAKHPNYIINDHYIKNESSV